MNSFYESRLTCCEPAMKKIKLHKAWKRTWIGILSETQKTELSLSYLVVILFQFVQHDIRSKLRQLTPSLSPSLYLAVFFLASIALALIKRDQLVFPLQNPSRHLPVWFNPWNWLIDCFERSQVMKWWLHKIYGSDQVIWWRSVGGSTQYSSIWVPKRAYQSAANHQ